MKKDKVSQKAWFWNGSIAAALIAAIAVFGVMLQMEKNVLTEYERGSIFVAVQEIPKGLMITKENCLEYFEERQLDKSCIPETALYSMEQVEGLVPTVSIEKGVLLTKGMFEELNEILGTMQEPVIAGMKAEDLYQMAGGVLRTGDRIHIYCLDENGDAKLVWENIFVQEVFDQAGNIIPSEDTQSAVQRMNVYLDKGSVEAFYSELTAGTLRVVKVCE